MRKSDKRNFIEFSLCFIIFIVLFGGCMRTGPYTVPKDQFDYAAAIGEAKKQQILMNIVKLRYAEWPVFLEVSQVVAGYNWEQTGSTQLLTSRLFDVEGTTTGTLGYTGKFIERPTITYAPLGGERFVRSILTPARPEALLTLIEAGFPADRLIMTMVESVNGKVNRRFMYGTDYPADPEFIRFVRLLRKIHLANGFTIRTIQNEDQTIAYELCFRPKLLDEQTLQELNDLKTALGLNLATDRYRLVWGAVSEDPNIMAIKTRSVVQVMASMAAFVEVPTHEISQGEVIDYDVDSHVNDLTLPRLVDIHSGPMAPPDAFVAIQYHGRWFWIDADDRNSKLSLAYLTLLLTITETSDAVNPQLTISTN